MIKGLLHGERVFFFLVVAVFFLPMKGHAEDEVSKFPTRPVTYIQPYTAGGTVDLAMRLISKEAEKFLGQPIVVVNKPGAVGTLGVAALATAKPDGYTIGNTPPPPMFSIPFLEKVPYHPIKDLQMIMQYGSYSLGVFVRSDSPFKSFKDLITFARQNPKKLTYGSPGTNSWMNIMMEYIAKEEKVQITQIPFRATVESQAALLGGHILFAIGEMNYSMIESGEMRLLLLVSEEHSPDYPQVPTLADLGDYGFLALPTFITVTGPKGIPGGIVKKLEDAFTKAMKEPAFVKGMKDLRLLTVYRNGRDLSAYVARGYETSGRILKDMGLIK